MGWIRRGAVPMACALALLAPQLVSSPASASPGTTAVQRRLNALGCGAGPADGRLGLHTRSAVLRFQSRQGLRQTGRLTPATRSRLATTRARCDVRPVPARSGHGRRVVVSQRQNWVWLVDAHNHAVAQGGIVDNPATLHRGRFHTGSYCGRAARVLHNTSGSLWLDHFVRFAACGFGFHRIPRAMSTGRQIHADYLLGTDLARSHGCIRLSAAMAARIWAFTGHATTPVRVV